MTNQYISINAKLHNNSKEFLTDISCVSDMIWILYGYNIKEYIIYKKQLIKICKSY